MKRPAALLVLTLAASFHSLAGGIVALSPHLTEWVYLLGEQHRLVAVSDFSDFPEAAAQLPSVASYQGVDFEAIVELNPTLILAWQGGNKPQDLKRLAGLGYELFYSSPQSPGDIADEIEQLGQRIGAEKIANEKATQFRQRLKAIERRYRQLPRLNTFYYIWANPLTTAGSDPWANQLLSTCGASNVFSHLPQAYPQVPMESVIRRKPQRLAAIMETDRETQLTVWRPWLNSLGLSPTDLAIASSKRLNRFSPRLIEDLDSLCQQLHQQP